MDTDRASVPLSGWEAERQDGEERKGEAGRRPVAAGSGHTEGTGFWKDVSRRHLGRGGGRCQGRARPCCRLLPPRSGERFPTY